MNPEGYWFKSSKFEIEPGEDQDINPGIYGRQLAVWLKQRLEESGFVVEAINKEDWGRCLVCQRDPFMLWVGCGNVWDYAGARSNDDADPSEKALTWHCFVTAEVPFWTRLFRRIDTASAVSKLNCALRDILSTDPQITVLEPR